MGGSYSSSGVCVRKEPWVIRGSPFRNGVDHFPVHDTGEFKRIGVDKDIGCV